MRTTTLSKSKSSIEPIYQAATEARQHHSLPNERRNDSRPSWFQWFQEAVAHHESEQEKIHCVQLFFSLRSVFFSWYRQARLAFARQ